MESTDGLAAQDGHEKNLAYDTRNGLMIFQLLYAPRLNRLMPFDIPPSLALPIGDLITAVTRPRRFCWLSRFLTGHIVIVEYPQSQIELEAHSL